MISGFRLSGVVDGAVTMAEGRFVQAMNDLEQTEKNLVSLLELASNIMTSFSAVDAREGKNATTACKQYIEKIKNIQETLQKYIHRAPVDLENRITSQEEYLKFKHNSDVCTILKRQLDASVEEMKGKEDRMNSETRR
ncbi:hypothetical protein AAMO2058_000406900 [Amorphochlora amoebiformis]